MKTVSQAVEDLRQLGYDVEAVNGAVMFYNISMKAAKKACREVGFMGSYGCRERKGSVE